CRCPARTGLSAGQRSLPSERTRASVNRGSIAARQRITGDGPAAGRGVSAGPPGSRRASALLLVLGLCAPSVAAQSPEDRQALAAFDSVLTAMNPEELGGHRDAARAQSVIDPLPLIRQGLVQLRLAQHQDTRQPLD